MLSAGRRLSLAAFAVLVIPAVGAQTPASADIQQSGQELLRYPDARRSAQVDVYGSAHVADPYRWLEEDRSAESRRWLAAEKALTAAYLANVPQRSTIRARLDTLNRFPSYAAPSRAGESIFWFENSGGENQPVLYVREAGTAIERVLLDPNVLSADGSVGVSAFAPSIDGRYVAYALSASAAGWQRIRVRDVHSGRVLADDLQRVRFSNIAWTHDSRGFFYEAYDSTSGGGPAGATSPIRGQKVFYHRVGQRQSSDQLIYERPDRPDWLYDTRVSDDGHYAIISIRPGADERNRLYFIDLDDPGHPRISAPVVRLFDNGDARYDFVSSRGQTFYIRTTRNAPRGQLVAVDINEPHEPQWQPIVREGLDPMVDARQVGHRFVVHFLRDAHSRLALYSLDGQSRGELTLPALSTVIELSTRAEDTDFFFTVTSFLSPPAVYEYDTDTRVDLLYRVSQLGVDLSPYETKEVFVTSRDGTQLPMFIVARKGLVLDGRHPVLLRAIGGFGIAATPRFSPAVIAWLEMGGVYALAGVRGGGEYGAAWHEAGTREHRRNAFDDFVAAASWLVAQGYTTPRRLAIAGAGSGGLLVGAMLTQHADLFAAALPSNGVLDMLRYQNFTIGWTWAPEYGTTDDAAQRRSLLAWSPLQNVKAGARYPATLVTAAQHDEEVVPSHSYKFTAALQAAQGGRAPILLEITEHAAHGVGAPLSTRLDENADQLAFLVRTLDVQR